MTADINLPVWSIAPNWRPGIREKLSWMTDVMMSTFGPEQRRALRLSPRREFEVSFLLADQERAFFDLWLHRMGSEEFMAPLFHDAGRLTEAVAPGATVIPFDTTYREFRVGDLAILLGGDGFTFDKVNIVSMTDTGITVEAGGVTRDWPAGSRIHPLRRSRISEESLLSALTSRAAQATLQFQLNQSNDIADEGEWVDMYSGYPVILAAPNRREQLDLSFMRNSLLLDNDHGLRALNDDAGRAFTVQSDSRMMAGRSEHWAFRQMLYRLRGMQGSVWLPTFNRDIVLARSAAADSSNIDINQIGYAYTGGAVSGRQHILVGGVMRRITGTGAALSTTEEHLNLDAPLGVELPAGTYGSFMDTCRLATDDIEILHHTDTDGVAECTLSFRSFRDERTFAEPIHVPLPDADKTNTLCGSPADEYMACVPDFPPEFNDDDGDGINDPPDEGGVGVPYDWALIEVELETMPELQRGYFLAVLRTPTTPDIDGLTADSSFPIQGMTYDYAYSGEHNAVPILAFPERDSAYSTAADSRSNFISLRVDLRTLPTGTDVEIDLHGYLTQYHIAGTTGVDDDGNVATLCTRSDFYGTLTRRYGDANPKTPGSETAAERYLSLKTGTTAFQYGLLISSFPEYAALPYVVEGAGSGRQMSVSFQWNTTLDPDQWEVLEPTVGGVPQLANPDDPNLWLAYPVINAGAADITTEYWGGSIHEKKRYREGGGVTTFIGPAPTIDNVTSFPSPPPGGKTTASISGSDNVELYVPTWRFAPAKTAIVKGLAVKGANPWVGTVLHPNSAGYAETLTWDNALTLNNVGSVTVDAVDDSAFPDTTLPARMGFPLLGVISVNRSSGVISFTPA